MLTHDPMLAHYGDFVVSPCSTPAAPRRPCGTITPPTKIQKFRLLLPISGGTMKVNPPRTPTPLDPPLSGGRNPTPSPDKGRVGEGFSFLPYDKNLTTLARENRKNPIAGYIVDFYCSELRLVIEIDGDSHADQAEYDAERTCVLNGLGLRVIRYTNREVLQNLTGVFDDLSCHINTREIP